MPKHVNEYDPRPSNSQQTRRIQEDFFKLKFNNIQSCIAVCLCVYAGAPIGGQRGGGGAWSYTVPSRVTKLIGIHFNTINLMQNEAEIDIAIQHLGAMHKPRFDVYMVGPYNRNYATSNLAAKLRGLGAEHVYVFNVNYRQTSEGADIDVKMENAGTHLNVFYRDHALPDFSQKKAKYDPAQGGVAPSLNQILNVGVNSYETDRANKPWQRITGFTTL